MYGKIFDDIFESSMIAYGGWLPTYIMQGMIVKADKDGLVNIAPMALYRLLGLSTDGSDSPVVSVKQFEKAIEFLEAPDPESRNTAFEGRRIIPLKDIEEVESNRGWWLVNYEFYRKKASKSEERGSSTDRVRKYRARKNGTEGNQELSLFGNGDVTGETRHTDTNTDNIFVQFWNLYPRKEAKPKAKTTFERLSKSDQQAVLDHLPERIAKQWQFTEKQFIPLPVTFLNQRRWEDEIIPPKGHEPDPSEPMSRAQRAAQKQ